MFFDYQHYKETFDFDTAKVQNAFREGVIQLLIPFNVVITLQNPDDESTTTAYTLSFDHFYGGTIIATCNDGRLFRTKRPYGQSAAQMILTDEPRE